MVLQYQANLRAVKRLDRQCWRAAMKTSVHEELSFARAAAGLLRATSRAGLGR